MFRLHISTYRRCIDDKCKHVIWKSNFRQVWFQQLHALKAMLEKSQARADDTSWVAIGNEIYNMRGTVLKYKNESLDRQRTRQQYHNQV